MSRLDISPYKPDWPQARRRWAAFWERANTDRPLIEVKAPRALVAPPLPPQSDEDRWLDPAYVERLTLHYLETTYLGGEAVPAHDLHPLMAGWTLGLGPGVAFAEDTIWYQPRMARIDQLDAWTPGPGDPWRRKVDRLLGHLLSAARGRFLVGYAYQLPVSDLLSLLRGPEELLIDLLENPGGCRRAVEALFARWVENFEHVRSLVNAAQPGCVWNWPGLWHDDFVMVTQSDMSCMISPALFASFVLAELDLLGERYGRVWYHLDGPQAVRHLDALLGRPYIRAVQYVPGDGQPPNGPHWLDLYRRVQAAGRCLDLTAPAEHVEFLIRRLRPEGLILRARVDTPEQADELVDRAARWAGSDLKGA